MATRIKLLPSPHYRKSGTKSYVHLMRKYRFTPTKGGRYFLSSSLHQTGRQYTHLPVGGRARIQHVLRKRIADTDETSDVGADDVQNDTMYLAPVSIGTPAQTIHLEVDTGSADLWVWSTHLAPATIAQHKTGTVFDPSKSSTFEEQSGSTWKISRDDGSFAFGTVGTDTISLGGLRVEHQAIELADSLSAQYEQGTGDGLLGLAFSHINTVRPQPVRTLVENMVAQEDIPESAKLFTAKLGCWQGANEPDEGEPFFTFGFIDQDIVTASGEEVYYTPIDNSRGFWLFDSASATVNGKTIARSGNKAIADTGTPLALVDDETCQAIYDAIPGAHYDDESQGYIFPSTTTADKLPVVSLAVGDKQFVVQREDLGFAEAKSGYVYGGIQSRGSMAMDILGSTFLKGIYPHLPLELREKLALLPESPSREEIYVLWTHLLQRYFPFRLHGSLPNLADLPDETAVKYALGYHQESESSHIALAVGRDYGPFDRLSFLHVFCQAETKEKWHLAEMQDKLKEEMMKSSHCEIARRRGMTIHGAIVVSRQVEFYKMKRDGSFECMTWLAQEKKRLHILRDMRTITSHLMQINYESGNTCAEINSYYYQCIPATATSTTTVTSPSSSGSSSANTSGYTTTTVLPSPTATQNPYPPANASSCGSWALVDNVCCPYYCLSDNESESCTSSCTGGCGSPDSSMCKSGTMWGEQHTVTSNEDWHYSRSTHFGLTSGGACGFGLYGLCTKNSVTASWTDPMLGSTCDAFCTAYPLLCKDPANVTLRGNFAAPNGDYYTQYGCPLPEGSHHMDLSDIAMGRLQGNGSLADGVIPIRYRRVPCPKPGNIYIWLHDGAGPYYFALSAVNTNGPGSVISIEVQAGGSGPWVALEHDPNYTSSRPQERYGSWVLPQGKGPITVPVSMRLTAPNGQQVVKEGAITSYTPPATAVEGFWYIDLGVQFT
ncbi:hypothetical protein KXX25_009217 [Aspergillus fumigatus]|nr:hypothetical protein KXX25_009217 [Aspergillus fumigatus]